MLELKRITKTYTTDDFTQKALDNVSINFRNREFVSILGPSGSGKTTLLNIIGGLDKYDDGDLIINNVSTKKYKDKNWDIYRNHKVGFVFQSYNLITHQSVLSNVELALTLSGIPKRERKERAINALDAVGLKKHIYKKPSQLSGGQMQRVAIARALVNNPEIILADEPTGALDTTTSKQIMEILKRISESKLVIMVTHNKELADLYSSRIIKILDGKIIDDSNPFDGEDDVFYETRSMRWKKTKERTSMKFFTAFNLSLNNLLTKKGRTALTAFAGSIGIIGIALILSLSDGVNTYMTNIQKETMLSYPITVQSKAMDLTNFLQSGKNTTEEKNKKKKNHKNDAVYTDGTLLYFASTMTTNIYENNLQKFKKYIDSKDNDIKKYASNSGIVYTYSTKFNIYSFDSDNTLVNSNGSTFKETIASSDELNEVNSNMEDSFDNIFTELLPDKKGEGINDAVKDEYKVIKGSWPKNFDEVVLIVDKNNEISATNLYYLGFLPSKNYKEILKSLENDKNFKYDTEKLNYDDILNKEFYLLTESDYYVKKDNNTFESIKLNEGKVQEIVKSKGLRLKVVGIVKQKKDSKNNLITSSVAYRKDLTDWMINHTNESEIIVEQENNKEINVLNGLKFSVNNDAEKIEDAKKYLSNLNTSDKAKLITILMQKQGLSSSNMVNMDEAALSAMLDEWLKNPDNNVLIDIYNNYISSGTYDGNMEKFGKVDKTKPSAISIYTDSFENKDKITEEIKKYNDKQKEEDKITYTDFVGLLMSSVTTIINAITYVLIAFVSISLIVSSIMIAIITYISVLERTKEIGILRAIGASKKDVSRVFKAETFIEGLISGVFGILITIILNIPINKIIFKLTEINNLSKLPLIGAISLILVSIFLTVIAGLIPSKIASKKDPVESLRSE